MINHLDGFDKRNQASELGSEEHCSGDEYQSIGCCSGIQRDRFELLSAYLDGEVSATERRQVETWLHQDPTTQRLYQRLLTLRQKLQTLPINRSEQSVEQLVDRVTARIERQPRRLLWGGVAVAAVFVGALFGSMPRESSIPSIANSLAPNEAVPSSGLMIALNHPPIEIPKATISAPADFNKVNQSVFRILHSNHHPGIIFKPQ